MKENQFLIGAGEIFLDDPFFAALMLQDGKNLTGDAFAETAAGGMINERAELIQQGQFFLRGKGKRRVGEYLLHLPRAFPAGNAFATALIAGEFFKNGQSLLRFR